MNARGGKADAERGQFFRANVGALIVDAKGRVLAFERRGAVDRPWQLPQGGLESGEQPADAALREVGEETGIAANRLALVAEAPEWLAYELPEAYRSDRTGRGQVQKWFLYRFLGSDADVRPDGEEFASWRWMEPVELLDAVVPFRRPVYERVLELFAPMLR